MRYCPRCDLAFCERHLAAHVPFTAIGTHDLSEKNARDYAVTFCSVCAGVVAA